MPAFKHSTSTTTLFLLVLVCAIAVITIPVSGAPMKISNWSSSPKEIHSGDVATISLNLDYTAVTSLNRSYIFSTGFHNATWNYRVWVNDQYIQSGVVQGEQVYTHSPMVGVEMNDSVRLYIQVTGTGPDVSQKTDIHAVGITEVLDEPYCVGVQTFVFARVYPAP